MKARDNPLATHRVLAIRYRPLEISWSQLMNRLEELNYRCAIVGPKGTGKTTLIEDLSDRLASRGFAPRLLRLSEEANRIDGSLLRDLTARAIVLFDGAEQLNIVRWLLLRWKTRCAGGLIITSHHAGRLPTLLATHTTPQLLHEITSQLLGNGSPSPSHADKLFARHRGNIREALRSLYDEFAAA